MNILWLSSNVPYPPKGGALQRNYNLIKEMSKNNDIYLLAFNQKALLPKDIDVEVAVKKLKDYCKYIEVVPLPSDRSKLSKYLLLLKSLFTTKPYTVNWNISRQMGELVNNVTLEFKPDLIHYDTIGFTEYYNKTFKGPQTLNHHNIESAMMYRRYEKETNIFKRLYFYQEAIKIRNYEKKYCGLFEVNLTVSEDDESTLRKNIGTKDIEIIPNGVDTNYFYTKKNNIQTKSMIFAGGMGWYPNRDAMIYFAKEIWPLLKEQYNDIKMTVIGRKPPESLLKLSSLDKNFSVTGFVDDVRPYLDNALIYVCPIRDGGGTRLKILDALSMGKPIVATSTAVEGIAVQNEKNVLIANTPDQFVRQIKRLIENKTLRDDLSKSGRELVEEYYDWVAIGNKMNNLYSKLSKK